jgi:membrane fusion protein (multidrug efflux system)
LQDDTIEQARANLEGAEAERNRAALDFTRYAHLVQDSWATRQRFETAKADAEKASAGVAAAKAALAARNNSITSSWRNARTRSRGSASRSR